MKPYSTTDIEADLRAAVDAGNHADIDRLGALVDEAEKREAKATPTILGAALWYAEQGLHVFPLQPGQKIPHKGTRGCKDATTDPDQIRAWWERWPDSNVAIATGHLVDVVDIDGPEGQKSRAEHWTNPFGRIDGDALAKILTPRVGGMHIYVPATGDGNNAGIFPGVDYRGAGGYVVAPPSRTDQGSYRFLGTPNLAGLGAKAA